MPSQLVQYYRHTYYIQPRNRILTIMSWLSYFLICFFGFKSYNPYFLLVQKQDIYFFAKILFLQSRNLIFQTMILLMWGAFLTWVSAVIAPLSKLLGKCLIQGWGSGSVDFWPAGTFFIGFGSYLLQRIYLFSSWTKYKPESTNLRLK